MMKIYILTIVIILILIILIITLLKNNKENLDVSSNEASQNVEAVYSNPAVKSVFNSIETKSIVTPTIHGQTIIMSDKENSEAKDRFLISYSKSNDTTRPNYIYLVPRKSDDGDWNWDNEIKIKDDATIEVPKIKTGAIYGTNFAIENEYAYNEPSDWAIGYFRLSEPEGTTRSFLFKKPDSNAVKLISYIKFGNYIVGHAYQTHDNYEKNDKTWMRKINNT